MSNVNAPPAPGGDAPFSIERLEVGLRVMKEGETDLNAFWDEHVAGFRKAVLLAIRNTTDALLLPTIPLGWRLELEAQLEELVNYIGLADRYIERRSISLGLPERAAASARPRHH